MVHGAGTMPPARITRRISITPANVATTIATALASSPKAPPVSHSGPWRVVSSRPSGALPPDTGTLKIQPCVKFQPLWMPIASHSRRVSR
jgi:hypothetical protein